MRRGLVLGLILLVPVVAWIGLRDWRRGYVSTRGATVVRFTLHSELVGRDLHEILVLPDGPAALKARRFPAPPPALVSPPAARPSLGGIAGQ